MKLNICANPLIPDSRLGHLPLTAFPQQMDGCRVLHISSHGATAFLAFEAVDGRVWQLRPEYLREVLARSRTQVRTVVSHPPVTRRTLRLALSLAIGVQHLSSVLWGGSWGGGRGNQIRLVVLSAGKSKLCGEAAQQAGSPHVIATTAEVCRWRCGVTPPLPTPFGLS